MILRTWLGGFVITIKLLWLPAMAFSEGSNPFERCRILVAASATPVERQAAVMLQEEVTKRTSLVWPLDNVRATSGTPQIILIDRNQTAGILQLSALHLPPSTTGESFSLRVQDGGRTIVVVGADQRGVLFGVGYLLRHLDMTMHRVMPHDLADIDSAPAYPLRGHQLGYRPKNNTFDAWSPRQFEQYIRELAIFGTNTIEIIPPRSDDDAVSPLYTLQPMPMMVQLSQILDRYGLDCSIWYPALDKDYADPAIVEAAVAEWGAVFDQLPRIDAIFVPGGDPGHTEPKYLMSLLEKEAVRLRRRHPHAQVWVSPQSFNASWMEEFYSLLAQDPKWLTGVVYGPEMRDSPEEFRRRVPVRFPIRFYPDITHVIDAQYPVPNLDPAYAMTEGREPINPRPQDESTLFHRYSPLTKGFVAYSEGSNDDVNKILWSSWGWDPKRPASAILDEYARTFISPLESGALAKSIQGLEEDWRGPLAGNASIGATLTSLQAIEKAQPDLVQTNWRLQQLLYRSYYDAYLRQRLLREQQAEQAALGLLQKVPVTDGALTDVLNTLNVAAECSTDRLCSHVQMLAGELFQSVGMQLSVPKYKALAVGRGANLDRVDAPLSDALWLRAQVEKALGEPNMARRTAMVTDTLSVLGVGGSGAYDILGEVSHAPHLLRGKSFDEDPSGLEGSYLGVAGGRASASAPLAWRTFAGTLYDRPLKMLYRDLAAHRTYVVQVHFTSDARHFSLLANGTKLLPHCEEEAGCLTASYAVPAESLPTGELRLAFSGEQGRGGNGRGVAVSTVRLSPVVADSGVRQVWRDDGRRAR